MDQKLIQQFQKHQVDGYTLLMIKEHDFEVHLKIDSLGYRKNLMRHINMLKTIWYKKTIVGEGLGQKNAAMSENNSIMADLSPNDHSKRTMALK